MLTSSRSLIAETRDSQLQRRHERWVRGTFTMPWPRRLAILLLAVATAVAVVLALLGRRGGIEPDPRLMAPDRAPCSPGKAEGCVGGKAAVIVVPAGAAASSLR